jgi:multiple sugar transport system permease protein
LLPAVLLFGAFIIYPIVRAALWSFTDLSLLEPGKAKYVGWANYRQVFADPNVGLDGNTRQEWRAMFRPGHDGARATWWRWVTFDWPGGAVWNTIKFTVLFLPPYVIVPLLLAWMLERIGRGAVLLRTVIFIPVIISLAVASVIWLILYNPNYGIFSLLMARCRELLNGMVAAVGGSQGYFKFLGPNWLGDRLWAMPSIAFMCFWNGMGLNVLLYLVGLNRIDPELYEAALVDGATARQQFFRITLPLLRPTTYLVVLLSLIGSLKVFGQMWIMTQGGPQESTVSYVMYLYRVAFDPSRDFEFGYASALAFVLAAVVFALTAMSQRFSRAVET